MQQLIRESFGRQPPASTGGASSSGRSLPNPVVGRHLQTLWQHRYGPGSGSRHQNILAPCRITSTSKELFQSKEAKDMRMEDTGEDTYIDLPDPQVYDADLGPFEKRIQRSLTDAIQDDKVDMRDTEYWFSTPEGNWNSKPKRLFFMSEDPEPMVPQPWHSPEREEDAGERIRYNELEEGRVVLGVVTDVWLYHGCQIDIGAEFDGLIPCTEQQWELAVDHINIGDLVTVEIHKMRMPGLYRWPLQLKFTARALQDLMLHPDDYDAPVHHGWAEANGWSTEDIAAATGRTLDTPSYFVPYDENAMAEEVIDGYGTGDMPWRARNSEPIADYIDDPLDNPVEAAWLRKRRDEVDAAISSVRF